MVPLRCCEVVLNYPVVLFNCMVTSLHLCFCGAAVEETIIKWSGDCELLAKKHPASDDDR